MRFEFRDASGGLLTRTRNLADAKGVVNSMPTPFSFVRKSSNLHRHIAASFTLSPDEKLFGGGESFTRLNKRGQKMVLWTYDAYSAQTPNMYKPVPFFMSSRGYGMFVHTSAPLTLDLGGSYGEAAVIYLGDDELDLFFFFGSPKEVLSEYTALTGRAPTPPLWTFGLWMGRETYSSEDGQGRREEAARAPNSPPTSSTSTPVGRRCPTAATSSSPSRFPDPRRMISDLKDDGFRISLWQLPYFNPNNELHAEAIEKGYVVLSAYGRPPVDDAVLDLSNPDAVRWYQEKLAHLLRMGVGIFTADFGEAAPSGIYHARGSSFLEHNLYPCATTRRSPRLQKRSPAAAPSTPAAPGPAASATRCTGAATRRSPTAGWPGPCAAASLWACAVSRSGATLSGFSYRTPRDLYRRWLPSARSAPTPAATARHPRSRSTARSSQTSSGASWSSATGSCRTSTLRPGSPPGKDTPCCAPCSSRVRRPTSDHRGPVPLRHGSRRPRSWKTDGPKRLPAAGALDRLPDRRDLRGREVAQHPGRRSAVALVRAARRYRTPG